MDRNPIILPSTTKTDFYKELQNVEEQDGVIRNKEIIFCDTCNLGIDENDGILLRECIHQFCENCVRSTIIRSEDAKIKCPSPDCVFFIQDREVHSLLSQDEFEIYSARIIRIAKSQMKNTYHCKLANCEGWCIFDDDDVRTFECPRCASVNCLACQAIHPRGRCQSYQEKLQKTLIDDEKRSVQYLDEIVRKNQGMRCPKCKIVIMKGEGYDWLQCLMCLTELCWATKQSRWGPKGRGDTTGGCKCGLNGKDLCHPNCRNCT